MAKTAPLGRMVDQLFAIREEVRKHEALAKVARGKKEEMEAQILAAMTGEQEVEKATGHLATVTISRLDVPQVEDWKKTERFILTNKMLYLYERRIAGKAYRELMAERKRPIPGIKTFEKVTLNLRGV